MSPIPATADVALAHDYLTQRGGAERVVAALCRAFPDAPLHTSVYEAEGTYPDFATRHVSTTWLQRIAPVRRNPRVGLPLLAPAVSRHRIDAPVTVCSTSGWAHGFPVSGRKVVYAHNTPRWLYQRDEYLANLPRSYALGLAPLLGPLRRWDRRAAATIDVAVVNSAVTRDRVRRYWGIDAEVVHPPVGVTPDGAQRAPDVAGGSPEPGFLLAVSRLLPYKRLDLLIDAVATRPGDRLVVVGDGPDRDRLCARAGSNVTFLPTVDDPGLRWLYANARALVTASHEDFGLTPVEALGFGTPTVAVAEGGFLETIVDGVTGLHFAEPTVSSLRAALERLDGHTFDPDALADQAARFTEATFAARMREIVAETAAGLR